jgi:hypothetical protein
MIGFHSLVRGAKVCVLFASWLPLIGSVVACSSADGAQGEEVGTVGLEYGYYDVTSAYTSPSTPKGWIIEWEIPELLNPESAVHVIGQWYNNLESGVYYIGGAWHVYYFGDDDGTTGNEPNCDLQWGSGGMCHGIFADFDAGDQVAFKYEFCDADKTPNVNGAQNCLYVDLKDGSGWRYLAQDSNYRPEGAEMYAHDVEHFYYDDDLAMPQISCENPVKMLGQKVKDSSGNWVTLSGASNFSFNAVSPWKFQNQNLSATPATWEVCSRTTATLALTSEWESGYCVDLTIANTGPGAITYWDAVIDLRQSTMNNNFNANFTHDGGSQYTVTPFFWNSTVDADDSTTVGFCGVKTGPDWQPRVLAEHGY